MPLPFYPVSQARVCLQESGANVAVIAAIEPYQARSGWYADPFGQHQLRYFNGDAWTQAVADGMPSSPSVTSTTRSSAVEEASVRESTEPGAGWFPDPVGKHQLRYFNGQDWTIAVGDGVTTERLPIPAWPPRPPLSGIAVGAIIAIVILAILFLIGLIGYANDWRGP